MRFRPSQADTVRAKLIINRRDPQDSALSSRLAPHSPLHHKTFLLKFARDRRRYRRWVFEAKKRFGLSVLNYMVTSVGGDRGWQFGLRS